MPGLSFGATYYNIDYRNYIGLPNFGNADELYRFTGNVITTSGITQGQLDAIIAQDTDGIIAPFGSTRPFGGLFGSATPGGTYAIFDARKSNFGSVKLDGVDFRLNYETDTGFGSVFFNLNGTYALNRQDKLGQTAPFRDVLSNDRSRLQARATLGAQVGNLLSQVMFNHRAGYDYSTPQGFSGTAVGGQTFAAQSSIGAFNTVDLFFRYDMKGTGIAKDFALMLNVENLFDQDPPEFRGPLTGAIAGIQNGSTIGRFVKFGISKKF